MTTDTTDTPNADLVTHIKMIHTLAEQAGVDGLLVLASFGEDPTTGVKLPTKVEHFRIGDPLRMIAAALAWGREQNRNVYAPLAIYRSDLIGGSKGAEKDIVVVLGLCADFDDANAGRWKERCPIVPNTVLETSKGRYQAFFCFDTPLPVTAAKRLAIALKAYADCDHGTADVSHVWRVAGCLNYPNKSKVDRGRSLEPQTVKVVKSWEGTLTDCKMLEAALAEQLRPTSAPVKDRPSSFFGEVNQAALDQLSAWVSKVFPTAKFQAGTGAYRVTSADLGRNYQEDLSIHPDGIRDFGAEKGLTPIDLLMKFGGEANPKDAAFALASYLGKTTESFGWGNATGGGYQAPAGPREWQRPHPLPSLPKVPPLDPSFLPNAFVPWVTDQSDRAKFAPDFLAVTGMVAFGSLVSRRLGIRPKENDDWTEYGNIWGMVIGLPSALKSPAMRAGLSPIKRLQIRANAKAVKEMEAYQIASLSAEIKKDAAIKAAKKTLTKDPSAKIDLKLEPDPTPPEPRAYYTSDVTVEKLGELVEQEPHSILVERDELSSWLTNLEDERNAAARGFYLSGWSGNEGYRFDRIMRGTVSIPAFALSVFGGIQPGPLEQYVRGAFSGERADGLLQRFQLAVWPEAPAFAYVDRWPDKQSKDIVSDLFEFADTFDTEKIGSFDHFRNGPPFVRFDPVAQGLFKEWYTDFMITRRARETSGEDCLALSSHFGKYPGLVCKLALITHIADQPNEPFISERTLLKALSWLEYLEPHARRIYHAASSPKADAARLLLSRIVKKIVTGPFKARDVYRKEWQGLSDATQVKAACQILVDYGYLREVDTEPQPKNGRPADPTYEINPFVFQ